MGFQRNSAITKNLIKSLIDSQKTEDYDVTRIFSFYFLDDLPVPLLLFFLKWGMSRLRISPGITFAGEDFDTFCEDLFMASFKVLHCVTFVFLKILAFLFLFFNVLVPFNMFLQGTCIDTCLVTIFIYVHFNKGISPV